MNIKKKEGEVQAGAPLGGTCKLDTRYETEECRISAPVADGVRNEIINQSINSYKRHSTSPASPAKLRTMQSLAHIIFLLSSQSFMRHSSSNEGIAQRLKDWSTLSFAMIARH